MEWQQTTGGSDSNEQRKAKIAALIRERQSCAVRGLEDRLPAIDAELRLLGYGAEKPAQRAEKRPAARKTTEKR